MASNKRKQDEKHLKMLREMVALPSNKTCFDCHQRGPTYVNMTIGSFVCTSCSGILRGLNPPHRVKSISMASFTPEEMEFLKSHGNEVNRKVYLGLFDNRTFPEPDSRDEQRVRDFMVQKYENKRFYVAPTDALLEEAKRMNEAALSKAPQTKPLRTLLGSDATKLVVGNNQTNNIPTGNVAAPRPVHQHPTQTTPAKSNTIDLLGIMDSPQTSAAVTADPFASTTSSSSNTGGGFADFSSFGATSASSSHTPASSAFPPSSSAFPPMSAPLQPFSGGGVGLQPLSATPTNPLAPQTSAASISSISDKYNSLQSGDKYAALADLSTTSETPTVNWGGMDTTVGGSSHASVNWGGGSSSTGMGDGPINWGGQSAASTAPSGSGGINWNSTGNSNVTSPVGGGGVFGVQAATSTANPFGGSSTSSGMQPNPFGGQSAGFGHPPASGAPGFGQPPASSAAGYGHAPASTAAGYGYGQFPVQNGGFGMTSSSGGFGNFGGPPTTAPPSYGVAQQQSYTQGMGAQGFGAMQQQPQAFPAQQGFGSGWGQMGGGMQPAASTANPFMVGNPSSGSQPYNPSMAAGQQFNPGQAYNPHASMAAHGQAYNPQASSGQQFNNAPSATNNSHLFNFGMP